MGLGLGKAVASRAEGRPEPPLVGRVVELPIEPCVVWGAAGPFLGSIICLIISWTHHYSLVTGAPLPPHCNSSESYQVPSLSMAIGVYKPNKFIWLFFIILHFLPRPFLGRLYSIVYESSTTQASNWVIYKVYTWLNTFHYHLAMVGILILTVVDFKSCFELHCFGFAVWLWSSCFVMTANTGLHHFSGWRNTSLRNEIMLWVKVVTTVLQISFSLSIAYIYPVIYLEKCRVWGHTLFTWLEYSLLFMDIAFCFFPLIEFPGIRLGMYIDYTALRQRGTYVTQPSTPPASGLVTLPSSSGSSTSGETSPSAPRYRQTKLIDKPTAAYI